jgi:hypothetical protein
LIYLKSSYCLLRNELGGHLDIDAKSVFAVNSKALLKERPFIPPLKDLILTHNFRGLQERRRNEERAT